VCRHGSYCRLEHADGWLSLLKKAFLTPQHAGMMLPSSCIAICACSNCKAGVLTK
jgi:hypothetical protein